MAQLNHFWRLICRGFCILMSHNGQVKKSCAFSGCAKMVFWLHTARTENQDTPQTHPGAFVFYEYHSDTPEHPPDIPQTSHRHLQTSHRHLQGTRHANRQQQTPIDPARHTQTAPVSVWRCLVVSAGVCSHVMFPGEALGVSGECLWDILGCLEVSECHSWNLEALGCVWGVSGFSFLAVWSQNTILAHP